MVSQLEGTPGFGGVGGVGGVVGQEMEGMDEH